MLTVTVVNLFAIFFAYLARKKSNQFFLKLSFFVLFLFLALRYNYGNDYQAYLEGFSEVNSTAPSLLGGEHHFEPGWLLLCYLFEPFGFFAMVAFLAAISCFVYYRFVQKYVPPEYYWFALFLYTFNTQMMLVNSSAMRQSLAGVVFIVAIDYLYKKNALKYVLCIALAASFHTSALVLLPLCLFALFDLKINTFISVFVFSLFILLYIFSKITGEYINFFINLYLEKFEVYDEAAELGSGLGIIFNAGVFAIILYYARSWDKNKLFLSLNAIFSMLILPFGLIISMIGRIGMYFIPATLAVFPFVFLSIKSTVARNMLIIAIVSMTLYGFYGFFQSDVYGEYFSKYQTVFSVPSIF